MVFESFIGDKNYPDWQQVHFLKTRDDVMILDVFNFALFSFFFFVN